MKIRCKNCYRVLDPLEEYCKSCGTHSEEIAKAMKTGNYGMDNSGRLKVSLFIFAAIAFIGTGIFMIIFGGFSNDATQSLFNKSNALLITSVITTITLYIVNAKSLKDYFINTDLKKLLLASVFFVIFGVVVVLLSQLTSFTRVLPSYVTDYLSSGTARFFSGKSTNIVFLFVSLLLVILTEELLFRRLIIDFFDEQTMLSDFFIILFTALIGTFLDFIWVMSPETLICSFIMNVLLSAIYMNTNRSVLPNILFRVIIVVIEFIIFLI